MNSLTRNFELFNAVFLINSDRNKGTVENDTHLYEFY